MKTLPDDLVSLDDHRADHRIRTGRPSALRRQAKGQSHVAQVLNAIGHRVLRATRDRRRLDLALVDFTRDEVVAFVDFPPSASASAAWAAANLAIGTRYGEQLT